MTQARIIDTHCHIIDPARFPFAAGPGYKPRVDEAGTTDEFCRVLDAHGVAHAVLVQPSGYAYDNSAVLDAMQRHPGRFKTIAVVDPETPMRDLAALAVRGVVGVRFNLPSFQPDALRGAAAEQFLGRLKELGWFAQVFADDAQWAEAAPLLRRSGVRVLVDHFGMRNPAAGLGQPGFQAVLRLGRERLASVKFSAPFRVSGAPGDFADLDPVVAALTAAFGIEGCLWGSDWPFINLPGGFRYEAALRAVERWLPEPAQRNAVLYANAARLFGFPVQP
jgi:predicted TIM-barrel fold metal-dependent hydrolase